MFGFTYGRCHGKALSTERQGRSGHFGQNSPAQPAIETRSIDTVLRQFTILTALIQGHRKRWTGFETALTVRVSTD